MKTFAERNPMIIGVIGLVAVAAVVVTAMRFDKLLPFITSAESYSAYFADVGAMASGAKVQVSGYEVGRVSAVELGASGVLVKFKVDRNVRLGERSEAAIKADTLLGVKILEVIPRGDGRLSEPIPLQRTRSPYQLGEALGDLTTTIGGIDTDQLNESLAALTETFKNAAPNLRVAVQGLSRFSETLNARDQQLRSLLANANKATTVLAERTDQVVRLVADTDALLAQLRTESTALDQIANNASRLSSELSGLIADNRDQLRPALDKLNGVLTIVDNRKERLQKAIKLLNSYALGLGESVSSGPFFNAYVVNLLPGQFVQPFVDAAFSDLGLDPNVLLPSERTDPPVGQAATPALPVPYPRTGQGGEPRLTLPDAITGNPGDPRYPYREPPPAPPPGGPPPGGPAPAPPGLESVPEPTPSPVYEPAPGEALPGPVPHGPTGQSGDGSR